MRRCIEYPEKYIPKVQSEGFFHFANGHIHGFQTHCRGKCLNLPPTLVEAVKDADKAGDHSQLAKSARQIQFAFSELLAIFHQV